MAKRKLGRVKIVDDDFDLKSLKTGDLTNTLEEDVGDNDPTIADIIDERPEHIKNLEKYRQDDRWKRFEESKSKDEESGQRNRRHDSDSDQSPLRTQRPDSNDDQSPVRQQRHDSDDDQSPVRRQRHDSDYDQSPVRKHRHDSDDDQSPPRKTNLKSPKGSSHERNNTKRHSGKQQRHSDSDQSPVRKKTHADSDSDQSPPRRGKNGSDSDQSPPRKQRRRSDSDQSPRRRKKQNSDSDQSPPRKRKQSSQSPRVRKGRHEYSTDDKKVNSEKSKKTLSGAKAGLSSAKEVRKETETLRRKHDAVFNQIDEGLLGRNAKTVFRDRKTGKRRNLKVEKEEQDVEDAKKREEDAKYELWGKGLKQQSEQDEAVQDAIHEMSKPLARARDDEDLDNMLRKLDRAGDPMAAFIKKKSSGNKKERPTYNKPFPPNRFGLRPGYRWDGVDRSNGFEKQYFAKMADRRATNDMAYKWSTEDM